MVRFAYALKRQLLRQRLAGEHAECLATIEQLVDGGERAVECSCLAFRPLRHDAEFVLLGEPLLDASTIDTGKEVISTAGGAFSREERRSQRYERRVELLLGVGQQSTDPACSQVQTWRHRRSPDGKRDARRSRICPPWPAEQMRAARTTSSPTYAAPSTVGAPVCKPIRTRTVVTLRPGVLRQPTLTRDRGCHRIVDTLEHSEELIRAAIHLEPARLSDRASKHTTVSLQQRAVVVAQLMHKRC